MIFTVQVVDWKQSVLDSTQPVSNQVWQHTMRLLETLHHYDITATFFVQQQVASKYPVLVRKIDAAGHEIACYIDTPLSEASFQQASHRAIHTLQDTTGKKVRGVRVKALNPLTTNFDHYCSHLKKNDIHYDSSIISALNSHQLARRNPSAGAFDAYGIANYALPVLMPCLRYTRLTFGGSSFRVLPYELITLLASTLNREHAVFHMPVYDMGTDEYSRLRTAYQLPLRKTFCFYGRKSIPEKLHKLFGDFPFNSFAGQYGLSWSQH